MSVSVAAAAADRCWLDGPQTGRGEKDELQPGDKVLRVQPGLCGGVGIGC